MSEQEFWLSLLSNGAATLLAGTILGLIGTAIFTRRFAKNEKKENNRDIQLKKERRSLEFMQTIKMEVEDIYLRLEMIQPRTMEAAKYRYFFFDDSFWKVLLTSGDIPSLYPPIVIQVLTNFYSRVGQCNALVEKVCLAEINSNGNKVFVFIDELKKNLQSLENINSGNNVMDLIDQVINQTEMRVATLEKLAKQ